MNVFRSNPNFALVWLGQILSQSGGRMFQIAIVWWLLNKMPDNAGKAIAIFMVASALPSLLGIRRIGETVDRYSSQKILVMCDLMAGVLILLVAFSLGSNSLSVWGLYLLGFVAAALQAHIDPTLNKSVSEVVRKADVETAVGFIASTQSIANFGGACLGAGLIGLLGVGGTCGLAAVGYFISAIASACARFERAPAEEASVKEVAGWSLLADYPLIKRLLLGFAAVNFFATPTLVVLPIYSKRVFNGTAQDLALFEAALWLGLLLGAWVASRLIVEGGRVALVSLCIAAFGAALGAPAFVAEKIFYLSALFGAGVALGIVNAKMLAFFQDVVPQDIKGRFFSLMQGMIGFTFPVAFFAFGYLTDIIDPRWVCAIQGGGIVLLSGYFAYLSGEGRRFEHTQRVVA